MFAEIDQALDELDDVVAAEEGTEMYAIFAEPINFSLVPLVVVGEETRLILHWLEKEAGYVHLRNVQKLLRTRQQFMVSEISLLYQVKFSPGHTIEKEHDSCSSISKPVQRFEGFINSNSHMSTMGKSLGRWINAILLCYLGCAH
ncbi:hypothetical protein CTI12_AA111830 [Artemisia annua]|uniref:Uncharacterized protein n=1 Tax=Artemisia annua TaxID=35608 RepID=A0A2U1PUD5_ARTAN|nr:hypothetical protein CTI12_AA111830 [Artemisia annua]